MASSKSTTSQFKQSIAPFLATFRKNMKANHRQLKRDLSQIASGLREDGRGEDIHAVAANLAAEFLERHIEDDAKLTERCIADVKRALSL